MIVSNSAQKNGLNSSGASSPPRQPRQLPWLIFETMINYKKWPKQLGRFEEEKKFYQAKKNCLNIFWGLLCRIEEINIFIILPSIKKLLIYPGSSLQNWQKWLYYSTKQKRRLKYPGSSLQNWRNKYFHYSTKHKKNSFKKYTGPSLSNWKNGFIILLNKKKPWISWVFWTESRPRMLKNRSQGWF